MKIDDIVEQRRVREILHFTTNLGLLGTLHSRAVKSRLRLGADKQLKYIFSPNAAFRKDKAWLDYVNLSVSRINSQFFEISSGSWHRHRDIWWCVLAFDPIILSHEGVYFTTTNNIYTAVQRGTGANAFEGMFGKVIKLWDRNITNRPPTMAPCFATCEQAEVLYPRELSTDFLKTVYVISGDDQDEAHGQISAVLHRKLPVIIDPSKFERISI